MSIAHLPERSVLKITGEGARAFLDGLVTNDLGLVTPGRAGFGALLTPQGKIITDFFMIELDAEDGGGFALDVPAAMAPDLLRRLLLYKLRAKVSIANISDTAAIVASVDGARLPPDCGVVFADPRHSTMGDRAIVGRDQLPEIAPGSTDEHHSHRIVLGMPDSGKDFAFAGNGAFPHEALMDQIGGVSFTKGCYVGQEVVSRMQHRGTARSRCVPVIFRDGFRSEWGVNVTAGGKSLGTVGSTAKDRGIALLRLDRVADALAAGEPMLAGGLEISLGPKPPFVHFPFPGETGFGKTGSGEDAA